VDDCIFCRIVKGEMPCYKVKETAGTLAFLDIHPVARGHLLVIPKEHIQYYEDLSAGTAQELSSVLQSMIQLLKSKLDFTDYNILFNNGPASGQIIPHLHAHIVPRQKDDRVMRFDMGPARDEKYFKELLACLKDQA